MSEDSDRLLMPDAILEIALKKEEQAYAFYRKLSTRTKVVMVRELIDKLCDEEYKHRKLIEDMIARMNLGHDVI